MAIDRAAVLAAIERAKARQAAIQQATNPALAIKQALATTGQTARIELKTPEQAAAEAAIAKQRSAFVWNEQQLEAIRRGVNNESFVLIGAAGTGKTTTLRGLLTAMLEEHKIPMLKSSTQYLFSGRPGIALVSYTRRAVRNIAKQMPDQLRDHCLTIHKLLEYAPEYYEALNEAGDTVNKMRFAPTKNRGNKLPRELRTIVVDESSMVSIDLFELILDALPDVAGTQFIFLGDLNQLPPVYGQAILGQKLLELPIVELTQVYRQALLSPIISLALAVKNNKFAQFNKDAVELWSGDRFVRADGRFNYAGFNATELKPGDKIFLEKPGHGKVTLHCWKKRFETDIAVQHMSGQLRRWILDGVLVPDEDLVLCPWNESFGTDELNRVIADQLGRMRKAEVWEIIAGFNKYYYAVGDKLMIDKQEAIVLEIQKNPKYIGKAAAKPSVNMDRWGGNAVTEDTFSDFDDMDLEALLGDTDVTDRSNEASHIIKVKMLDTDEEIFVSKSAVFNASSFGYAMTVHKAQGSECRRVFFLTHYCHSAMLFRELVYTAITRAAEELYIVMSPMMLEKAGRRARIKGDTLKDKLAYFTEKLQERIADMEDDE